MTKANTIVWRRRGVRAGLYAVHAVKSFAVYLTDRAGAVFLKLI